MYVAIWSTCLYHTWWWRKVIDYELSRNLSNSLCASDTFCLIPNNSAKYPTNCVHKKCNTKNTLSSWRKLMSVRHRTSSVLRITDRLLFFPVHTSALLCVVDPVLFENDRVSKNLSRKTLFQFRRRCCTSWDSSLLSCLLHWPATKLQPLCRNKIESYCNIESSRLRKRVRERERGRKFTLPPKEGNEIWTLSPHFLVRSLELALSFLRTCPTN